MLTFLLQLAAAVALLLWAVRHIRTGVERGFAVHLRRWLRRAGENRALGLITGAGAAMLLQSATAVTMLTTAFAAAGTMEVAAGLVIVLGADLGSALAAQILLARADWLAPLFLLVGVALFLRGRAHAMRQGGRVLLGIGLVFVSLDMLRAVTSVLRDGEAAVNLAAPLSADLFLAFIVAAVFAWAVHSSIAAVLLVVTLASAGVMPADVALATVLGANLGGAVIPVVLTMGGDITVRRIVAANLVLRGGGALAVLAGLRLLAPDLDALGPSPGVLAIGLHIGFNLAIALIGAATAGPVARAARALVRPVQSTAALARSSALDPAALGDPPRALAGAAREVLRMAEESEAMIRPLMGLYARWDAELGASIRSSKKNVDATHRAVKLYLAKLQRASLDEAQATRAHDLTTMATHIETACEAVTGSLLEGASRMHGDGLRFSAEGQKELGDFHDRVLANAQLALNVLVTGDVDAARQLVAEKEKVRAVERELNRAHLARLREGNSESIETTNHHQDAIRALKQINTGFSMIGYPLLAASGDLLESRLAGAERDSDAG